MYLPVIFSGSTNGKPVVVDATSSPGTLVHTLATATAAFEDAFIDAYNTATNDATLNVELGATGENVTLLVPSRSGPFRIVAGARLAGGSGLTIRAYATATGILKVTGAINRSL